MTRMDRLWKKYDQAVDKIPRGDALAFRRYAEHLDHFFVCYWQVFNDSGGDVAVDDLVRMSDAQYHDSMRVLDLTWHNTTDALMRRGSELKDKSRARSLPQLLAIFQKAERLLKDARKDGTILARIESHEEAADLLEEFIGKLEAAN